MRCDMKTRLALFRPVLAGLLAVAGACGAMAQTTGTTVSSVVKGPGWVMPGLTDVLPARAAYATSPYSGRAYHFDASTGNDTNPGTLEAPLRSFAPIAAMRLAAGDALLLKCGEVWRSTLELTTTQAPNGGVLIGAYGDCSGNRRPFIRASDWVSNMGWTLLTAGSQNVTYTRPWANPVGRLFLNGMPLTPARHPNFRGVGAEYALVASVSVADSRVAFTVGSAERAFFADKDLVGATIHLKNIQWETTRATVTAYDPVSGKLTMDRVMAFSIQPGSGYILEGKSWMLDGPGEWHHDATAGQLRLWTPTGGSPAALTGLEASSRSFGVLLKWARDMRVERLQLEQQEVDSLELTETPGVSVRDVFVRHARELGISALTAPGASIVDSIVEGAGDTGIVTRESNDARILRNHVRDTGGFGRAGPTDSGIAVFGQGSIVEDNLVERSAHHGIRFANRSGTVVRNNTVVRICLRFTDCSGIYTYTGGAASAMPASYVAAGLIEGNVVVSARSITEGCGYSCVNMAHGIYLDELTAGVTITGNTVSEVEVGIGVLNASHNRVLNNTVRNASAAAFRGNRTRSETVVMRGNRVENNTFFSHTPTALNASRLPADTTPWYAQYWRNTVDAALLFDPAANQNVVTGNTIVSTMASGEVTWGLATGSNLRVLKVADWRRFAPTDVEVRPIVYARHLPTLEPSLVPNSGFDPARAAEWRPYIAPSGSGGSFSMGSFSACTLGCARFVAGSTADYLESLPFSLDSNVDRNLYLLRYTAIGGQGGGMRRALVRRNVSPWENFGLSVPSQALAPGETGRVEAYFRASATSSAAVLDIRGVVGGETFLRDLSLSRVANMEYLNLNRVVSHVVNPRNQVMTFPCVVLELANCDLIDETGASVSFPIVVAARSSRLLFARDRRWMP